LADQIAVCIRCPPDMRYSGLMLYGDALADALGKSGIYAVTRQDWFSAATGRADVEMWCGLPHPLGEAERAVDLMLARGDGHVVLLPEWEGHTTDEFAALVAPLAPRPIRLIAMNNEAIAAAVTDRYPSWTARYIPTPLEAAAFAPLRRSRHHDRVRAVYLGKLTANKRVDVLLDTWRDPDVRSMSTLDIYTSSDPATIDVGNGIGVRRLSESNSTTDRFDWYEQHDVYVSASEFETGPIAALEAMARGCVPVLSDRPGHRELARRSMACIIIESRRQLQAVVADCAREPAKLHSLSAAGAAYVRRSHSPQRIAAEFSALLGQ
jgi:glycosyltransferase involved in cell wall biosynthesis